MVVVPITWFLTLMCWLSQKSTDWIHKQAPADTDIKKKA
jgi:hypothetical protein